MSKIKLKKPPKPCTKQATWSIAGATIIHACEKHVADMACSGDVLYVYDGEERCCYVA